MLLTYIIKITTNKKFKYLKYALLQKKKLEMSATQFKKLSDFLRFFFIKLTNKSFKIYPGLCSKMQ